MGRNPAVGRQGPAHHAAVIPAESEARRLRQAEAQGVELLLEVRAAAGAGVDGDAGGLVDHQHQAVAVEQAGEEAFRHPIPARVRPPRPTSPGSCAPRA